MFDEIFDRIHQKIDEIVYCAVCGKDGLILEQKSYGSTGVIEPELLSAEMAEIAVKNDSLAVTPDTYYSEYDLDNGMLFVFSLSPEYYLLVLSDKSAIRGRLRFYIDLNLDALRQMV